MSPHYTCETTQTWCHACPRVMMVKSGALIASIYSQPCFYPNYYSFTCRPTHYREDASRHAAVAVLLTQLHPVCILLGLRPCGMVSTLLGHVRLCCQSTDGPDGSLGWSSEPLATLLKKKTREKNLPEIKFWQFRDGKTDKRPVRWKPVKINNKSHLLTFTGKNYCLSLPPEAPPK